MSLFESGEMYLETIHVLTQERGNVRSIDIAEYMNFSKPSVSRAIHNLIDNGYITVDEKGYIHLTEKGQKVADGVYEKHLVLSEYLTLLGVSHDNAVADACKIEHYISEESFEAVKRQLAILKNK
ncbi:MAG: metal-dependent transcriptional regulator [Erysipelotrichaceae bacterium]|jgi:DtxR family Mn-dependent transcriptional regulator|nr:metal-dependent transcriptional regulator [Erysipelotrichaceae bacterium]